jgi:putative Mg2+ transporter-C (MgtC) family protein
MEPYIVADSEILIRLLVAMFLGGILGIERLFAGKTAGMRTYALVSIGSAVFIMTALMVGEWYMGRMGFDPLRMATQLPVGIGFLGAGLIIFKGSHVRGLTTAAGLWVAAGVGMAVGFGLYHLALLTTLVTLFVFSVLGYVKQKLHSRLDRFMFLDSIDDEEDI